MLQPVIIDNSIFGIKQTALHSNLANVNYFNRIMRADSPSKNRIKKGTLD